MGRFEESQKAEEICKNWMSALRKGTKRTGYEHCADVVEVVRQLPGIRANVSTQFFMESLAWIHSVLEHGKKPDGKEVTKQDLLDAGISAETAFAIDYWLTAKRYTTRFLIWYAIEDSVENVKMVSCADRLASLREGISSYDDVRWTHLVGDTLKYYPSHLAGLGQPWGGWLEKEIHEICCARPRVKLYKNKVKQPRTVLLPPTREGDK